MVKSDTLGGIDVVLFGFLLIPILFLGLTGDHVIMLLLCAASIIARILIQVALRGMVTGYASKHLRLDRWSFNAMFLSMGGAIAIVFGFEGGLTTTALIGIPILIVWFILNHYIYGRASLSDDV